jgi:hypothetical protein
MPPSPSPTPTAASATRRRMSASTARRSARPWTRTAAWS